jgi:hypothetical protein
LKLTSIIKRARPKTPELILSPVKSSHRTTFMFSGSRKELTMQLLSRCSKSLEQLNQPPLDAETKESFSTQGMFASRIQLQQQMQ